MPYQILAKSWKRINGEMLPMKQWKEQEAKKSEQQKNDEVCNFINTAFCVNGDVSLVYSDKPITTKTFFVVEDKFKWKYAVAIIVL